MKLLWSSLDVVINNAGCTVTGRIEVTEQEARQLQIETNVRRALLPRLRCRPCASSAAASHHPQYRIGGVTAFPGTPYHASKRALEGPSSQALGG